MPEDAPLFMSVSKAAKRLGVGYPMARQLVRTGDLASVLIGKRYKVPVAAIEQFEKRASNLLSVSEAASRLGVGVDSVWRMVTTGELASIPVTPGGRTRKIPVSALDEYVRKAIEGSTCD